MTDKWQTILEAISVVNLDTIKKDKINAMLDYDRTVDAQVLDNLYIAKVLTLAEYKWRMSQYIVRSMEVTHYAKERLKKAEEQGEEYSPMQFYGFGRPYMGGPIEDTINNPEYIRKKENRP